MRHNVGYLISGIIIGIFLFNSCSSAPPAPDGKYDIKNEAAEYAEFGNNYYAKAQYEQALSFFNLALQKNISVDNLKGIAQSYNSLSKVYATLGEIEKAKAYYERAITFAEVSNSNTVLLQTHNNRGEFYLAQNEYQQAIEKFQEALKYEATETPPKEIAIVYHNLGTAHKGQGNLEEARNYFEQAYKINSELKLFSEMASNQYMISSIYSKNEDYTNALQYMELALENDKLDENSLGIAKDLDKIGFLNDKLGNYDAAYFAYQRCLQVYNTLSLPEKMIPILETLQNLAEILNKTSDAESYKKTLETIAKIQEEAQ